MDQGRGSIHREKNLSTEIHILGRRGSAFINFLELIIENSLQIFAEKRPIVSKCPKNQQILS